MPLPVLGVSQLGVTIEPYRIEWPVCRSGTIPSMGGCVSRACIKHTSLLFTNRYVYMWIYIQEYIYTMVSFKGVGYTYILYIYHD